MSGVEEEPPRRPSRPQPPPHADHPRPPSINAGIKTPSVSSGLSGGDKPAPAKVVVPTIFKLVSNGTQPPIGFDRSNRASGAVKSSNDSTSPRKETPLPPTPAKKSSTAPVAPSKPKLTNQPSNGDLGSPYSLSGQNTRIAAENAVLRQQLEDKSKREVDLLVDMETASRLAEQYKTDLDRLTARIRELEGGSGSPSNSGGPVPPAKPRPAPPVKDSTKEERSTNALLLEKKAMIEVLEQENLMLRDDCSKAEKKNQEDAQNIKSLNNLVQSLRREVESLRSQVQMESSPVASTTVSFSSGDQKRMEDALLNGTLYETVYAFEVEGSDDVELKEGHLVEVLAQSEDGWWKGYNFNTGFTGVFPSNYVKLKEGQVIEEKEDGRVVRALFDYSATAPDEISFKANDRLRILLENSNGWWLGRNLETDSSGLFPSNYAGDE